MNRKNTNPDFKHCPKCGETKSTDQFKKNKSRYDGLGTYCKPCFKEYNKKYSKAFDEREKLKNAPLIAERKAIAEQNKIERELAKQNHTKTIRQQLRAQGLNRCIKCDEVKPIDAFEFDRSKSGYRNQCKVCKREIDKSSSWKNSIEYKKKLSDIQNAYTKKRKKTDAIFYLKTRVRKVITHAITRKGYKKNGRSFQILGCNYPEFKAYIENQFKDGMCWERFNEIHIDHIIPMKSAKTEADVLRLNHYTNLQPLWAHDNMTKHASMPPVTVQNKIHSSYARAKQIKLKQQTIFDVEVPVAREPAPHFWGLGVVRKIYD